MRTLVIITLIAFLAAAGWAQDTSQDDRGYLQALLEDNLSDAGREVRIKGFKGALSSSATIEELTIADDDGIWITLHNVALDWTRSALLAGKLEVNRLNAEEILLPRLPKGDAGLSPADAEATDFSLPELPVSIRIGEISADLVYLGQAVFGAEAELSVTGSAILSSGNGQANLAVSRTDGRGELTLDAGYSNITSVLALKLDLREDEDGIAANLLGLPDRPALDLQIEGEDPLSNFTALITLASAGEPRLQGDIQIQSTQSPNEPGKQFSANLQGDLAPLFKPDYRRFFGDQSRLALEGVASDSGKVEISNLTLASAALVLAGQLELNADHWPVRFNLNGQLGDGTRIRLPISGPGTWVEKAQVAARFDAEQDNQWQADITFSELEQNALKVARGTLSATGVIGQSTVKSVSARLEVSVDGIENSDQALAKAMGTTLNGSADIDWQEGAPLEVSDLTLKSGDVQLEGDATLDGLSEGFPASGHLRIVADDLGRFGPLANRGLAGRADATLSGNGTLLGGAFDIKLDAQMTDLNTSTPRLDPLLAGKSNMQLAVMRDTSGTVLRKLAFINDALSANAAGRIDTDRGKLGITAQIFDISLVEPKLSGPAKVASDFSWQAGGDVTLTALNLQVADATLNAAGSVSPERPGLPVTGNLQATINDLSRFAALSKQNLAGKLDLSLDGSGALQGQDFQVSASLNGNGVKTGIATLDQLIAGSLTFSTVSGRSGNQLDIRSLSLKSSQLQLDIKGDDNRTGPLQINGRLANLGLLAPGFDGPLSASGTIAHLGPDARDVAVALSAIGPGGTTANVQGNIVNYGERVDLALTGKAPMALANNFITPRSVQGNAAFDLRLSGPPTLSALSGTISTNDARLSLPALKFAVQNVAGTVSLASGSAQIDMAGQLRDGGRATVAGTINLATPFVGDISANLENAVLTDRILYETTVNGNVAIAGPLTGGARIGGELQLDETTVRIPSSTAAASVSLPDIQHLNEPANVRATRARAGLVKTAETKPGKPFPLSLTINAPNRIFVRGRGLDAELGGRLFLTGDTNNVVPSGFFQLIRGRLDILGKRLDLTEGLIDLRGALDPYLRFVAETQSDDISIQVIIEGLASEPEITFQSQPELPQEEVVSRLLFGRGLDTVSPFQAAQLASAVATLAGRSNNDIVGRLRDTVGLSDLDISSTEEGSTQVKAGAYLSKNIYSEVTADSEGRQEINLNLDINSRLTVKGGLDNEGGTGLGIFFEKDY